MQYKEVLVTITNNTVLNICKFLREILKVLIMRKKPCNYVSAGCKLDLLRLSFGKVYKYRLITLYI